MFDFILGLRSIQPLVLGYPSSVEYGFLLMEWVLSQITQWLTTPQVLSYNCPNIFCKQDRVYIKSFMVELVFTFLFQQSAECLPTPKTKIQAPVQLLHVFNELCGCCPWQCSPAVSLWRATFCLSKSLGCLKISMGTPCPTTQLNATYSFHWKPCLATRDGLLRLCISHYQEYSLGHFHRFPHNLPNDPQFQLSPPCTLSILLIPHPFHSHLHPALPRPSTHKIYSISLPREILTFPLLFI